jgi:hypothetical protein
VSEVGACLRQVVSEPEFLSVYFKQERQEIKSSLIHMSSVVRA